jgi:hypothetical protein
MAQISTPIEPLKSYTIALLDRESNNLGIKYQKVQIDSLTTRYIINHNLWGISGHIDLRKINEELCDVIYLISTAIDESEVVYFLITTYGEIRKMNITQQLERRPLTPLSDIKDLMETYNEFTILSTIPDFPDFIEDLSKLDGSDPAFGVHFYKLFQSKIEQYFLNKRRGIFDQLSLLHWNGIVLPLGNQTSVSIGKEQKNIASQSVSPIIKMRRGGPLPLPDDEQKKIIDEWLNKQFTITQEQFCAQKGISSSRLRKWKKKHYPNI